MIRRSSLKAMSKDSSTAMNSPRHLGAMGIMKETFIIPCRNKKLMLPIMLLAFTPSSLLIMANYVSIYPLLLNLVIKLYLLTKNVANTPEINDILLGIQRDIEALVQIDLIFSIASYVVSLFSTMIIIHASAMIYSGVKLEPCGLLERMKRTWKGPIVTQLYFTLLRAGYTVMFVTLVAAVVLSSKGSIGIIVLSMVLALVARLIYVYLAMVWMVGVVISVLEEGCYGMEALGKAGVFVKGRRVQGFLIAITFVVVDGVLRGTYAFEVTMIKSKFVLETMKTTGFVLLNLLLLLKIFSQMVYTVFYFECRRTHGKEGAILREYTMVHATTIDDESSPLTQGV